MYFLWNSNECKKTYGQNFGHHQEPIIANLP